MPATPAPRAARRLALLGVACFGTMAALRVCDSLLPSLADAYGTTTGRAGHTVSAFAIAYGLALLLWGPLADRHGKFRIISIATLGCTLGSAACALAPSLDALIALRAVSGIAAAGVTPLAMAWIGDTVPYERRQEVLAQLLTATTLGLIAGQSFGGVLADSLGWRWAFGLLTLLFAVTGMVMGVELQRDRRAAAPPSRAGCLPPRHHVAVARVFALPWARRMLAFSFAEGVFVFGGLAFLPAHLHQRFGLPVAWAGAVLALYGLGGLLYSRLARPLLRRCGETGLARLGGALLCLYFGMLAMLPSWHWALPACLAGGLGFYMLHNTLQTHATQMAPAARGTAVTLFSSALFMGQSIGVAVAATVVDARSAIPVFVVSALALPLLAALFASQARARVAGGHAVDAQPR